MGWELIRAVPMLAAVLATGLAGAVDGVSGDTTAQTVERNYVVQRELLGQGLLNDNRAILGIIDDLVIDRTGTTRYLLVRPTASFGTGEVRVAVPWHALTLSSDGNLVLPLSIASFKAAPTWRGLRQRAADPEWDRVVYDYYGLVVVPEILVFAQLDTDDDGVVSRAEAQDSRAVGIQFNALDKNRDARLTPAEFKAFEELTSLAR